MSDTVYPKETPCEDIFFWKEPTCEEFFEYPEVEYVPLNPTENVTEVSIIDIVSLSSGYCEHTNTECTTQSEYQVTYTGVAGMIRWTVSGAHIISNNGSDTVTAKSTANNDVYCVVQCEVIGLNGDKLIKEFVHQHVNLYVEPIPATTIDPFSDGSHLETFTFDDTYNGLINSTRSIAQYGTVPFIDSPIGKEIQFNTDNTNYIAASSGCDDLMLDYLNISCFITMRSGGGVAVSNGYYANGNGSTANSGIMINTGTDGTISARYLVRNSELYTDSLGAERESYAILTSYTGLELNKRYHVSVNIYSNRLELYVDAVLVAYVDSVGFMNMPYTGSSYWAVGCVSYGTSRRDYPFDGDVDQLMYFNRPLVRQEINILRHMEDI